MTRTPIGPAAPPARESGATPMRVQAALEGLSVRIVAARDALTTVEVERGEWHATLQRLRDRAGFQALTLVTGVDRLPAEPRFEVVAQLLALVQRDRVRVRTHLAEADACVGTITDLWPGAAYMERECFDLFGIRFEGHRDLKRLMMPDDYGWHPLRKDFPHQGIEPGRLYREWDARRRAAWKEPRGS
jgi:NADH-quinone oxidoreductase subunit C